MDVELSPSPHQQHRLPAARDTYHDGSNSYSIVVSGEGEQVGDDPARDVPVSPRRSPLRRLLHSLYQRIAEEFSGTRGANNDHEDEQSLDTLDFYLMSPAQQRENLRVKRLRTFLKCAREFKSVIVFVILIFTVHLHLSERSSNNWESTRLMGFTEPGVCAATAKDYRVNMFNVNQTSSSQKRTLLASPQGVERQSLRAASEYKYTKLYRNDLHTRALDVILVQDNDSEEEEEEDEDEHEDQKDYYYFDDDAQSAVYKPFVNYRNLGALSASLCVSSHTLSHCQSTLIALDTGRGKYSFKGLFGRPQRSYFPFLLWFDVLCGASLLIALLFELDDKGQRFAQPEEGAFSTPGQRKVMQMINIVVVLAIAVLCFIAATEFRLLYPEDCWSLYQEHDVEAFCGSLQACGIEVSSLIAPPGALLENYSIVMPALGIALIVSLAMRFVLPRKVRFVVSPLVNPLDADDEFPQRSRAPLTEADFERCWTLLGDGELLKLESECAICLNPLVDGHRRNHLMKSHHHDQRYVYAEEVPEITLMPTDQEIVDASAVEHHSVAQIRCNHIFHRHCLSDWFRQNQTTCPVCRAQVLD